LIFVSVGFPTSAGADLQLNEALPSVNLREAGRQAWISSAEG
jgi:hypothetical protein